MRRTLTWRYVSEHRRVECAGRFPIDAVRKACKVARKEGGSQLVILNHAGLSVVWVSIAYVLLRREQGSKQHGYQITIHEVGNAPCTLDPVARGIVNEDRTHADSVMGTLYELVKPYSTNLGIKDIPSMKARVCAAINLCDPGEKAAVVAFRAGVSVDEAILYGWDDGEDGDTDTDTTTPESEPESVEGDPWAECHTCHRVHPSGENCPDCYDEWREHLESVRFELLDISLSGNVYQCNGVSWHQAKGDRMLRAIVDDALYRIAFDKDSGLWSLMVQDSIGAPVVLDLNKSSLALAQRVRL